MNWLAVTVSAYLLLAFSSVLDKIFLSKVFNTSIFYVIWVSLFSLAVFIFLPLVTWIGWGWFLLSLLTGGIFTLSLYLLYTALRSGEASRIVPLVGGAIPLIVFMVSWLFNLEDFTVKKVLAFIALILGSLLIMIMPSHGHKLVRTQGFYWALGASLSFATFFILTKLILDNQSFINGIVWPRVGTLVVLLIMLLYKENRHVFLYGVHHLSFKLRAIILGNQIVAAMGFLGQNYAIYLGGSLSLIMALQGVQYAFILLMAAVMTWKFPSLINEKVSKEIITQKVLALILIAIGLYYITI